MSKKTEQLLIRLDIELMAELDNISAELGIAKAEITRSAIKAVCKTYKESGTIGFPIQVMPSVTAANIDWEALKKINAQTASGDKDRAQKSA